MRFPRLFKASLTALIVLAFCLPASAAINLYDTDGTTFSVDGYFNVFYANSKSNNADLTQSRVKMGFLPNTIGFNFGKQTGNLKLGGRSSFWVTINDSDSSAATATAIDVRQFYATVDGPFGQVLLGKDFGLFGRSNIFKDEILQGFGRTGDLAGPNTTGVSLGNINSGYPYAAPTAQITYRTPDMRGFKLAVGIFDPARNGATSVQEKAPRFEAEANFDKTFGKVAVSAWVNGVTQSSQSNTPGVDNYDANGIGYGLNGKVAGFSLTASGFSGKGIGAFGANLANALHGADNRDTKGYLVQGSYTIDKIRVAGSYGKSTYDAIGTTPKFEDKAYIGAVFYSLNSNLTLEAEYNVEKYTDTAFGSDEKISTLALGAIVTF
ncbi:porin [Geopsychrobacter electrodiphilus]|uniref:porin n=1 Tax=Geopsychrobacter electrodiphilus TaxID=225196 RepID=UPI00037830A7|nr:porin [Geopsychrobacter electrodiphilus]